MTNLNVVVLNSSPKAEKSNTQIMVEAFSEGARSAGAAVSTIFLAKYNIRPCIGCFKCWTKTPGSCVLHDAAEALIDKISSADFLIFATPLYFDNVSGIMKNFMDRMIMKACPTIEIDEAGETRHVVSDAHPAKIGVISNCGFPEQTHFQVLRLYFRRVARNMKAQLAVEIYRGEGPLLNASKDNKVLRPIIHAYKELLKKAGEEVVANGRLSSNLMEKLERPLISYEQYCEITNKKFIKN